ncbi:CidA/LrgA family protein [Alicyclobacillus macrosporangiidus]|uniref:CidA/LrgA family protein n=1 Tax=Alicyclobacillus macrosporangiidus TaxID=392015 RepID=UPI001E566692|nr:CidA/LrgA family holin-like protein [Alicyclobacillus macrosporangiidus]
MRFVHTMQRAVQVIVQTGLLWGLAAVCNRIVQQVHLPIPGSILGCAVLFFLLLFGVVKLSWIEAGADWLLAQLLLFFIPSAVGIIQYPSLFLQDGWRLVLVILTSTVLVMTATGLTADLLSRRRYGLHNARAAVGSTGARTGRRTG